MEFTGYIEGYFGRTLTWPQRRGIIDQLARLGMNRYLYAPKEDPYHRVRWKESYPADWHDELSNLASHAARQGVTLVPAPGSRSFLLLLIRKRLCRFAGEVQIVS
jgi:hyaluronoglucosaminidase